MPNPNPLDAATLRAVLREYKPGREGETFTLWLEKKLEAASRLAAPPVEGWQPIETAPKDGTWFLICCAEEGFNSYEVGQWDPYMAYTFEPEGDLYRKVKKSIYDWRGFNNMHRATHGMPLPTPPSSNTGQTPSLEQGK